MKKEDIVSEFDDVVQFNRTVLLANTPARPTPLERRCYRERLECMLEELGEYRQAYLNDDLAGVADALVDLVWFAKGTAALLGLPWDALWKEVTMANLRKVPGVTHRGHQRDAAKPEGWQPPDIHGVLKRFGYHAP